MAQYSNYNYQPAYPSYQQMIQQQYPQYQQPIQQPMQPAQQVHQNNTPVQPGVVARSVSDFSEIVANDVPMDGRIAVFPKNDLSEVQIRTWGADGLITPITYRPVQGVQTDGQTQDKKQENSRSISISDDIVQNFIQRFDDLSIRLGNIEQTVIKPVTKGKTASKKDGEQT